VRLAGIAPGTRAIARWTMTPAVRGEYPRVPLTVQCGFPFGLWQARRPIRVDVPVLVWPQAAPVGPAPAAEGDDHMDGQMARNKVGGSGDVLAARPYPRVRKCVGPTRAKIGCPGHLYGFRRIN
jgi:uncharacterized protein (DUF58 family)